MCSSPGVCARQVRRRSCFWVQQVAPLITGWPGISSCFQKNVGKVVRRQRERPVSCCCFATAGDRIRTRLLSFESQGREKLVPDFGQSFSFSRESSGRSERALFCQQFHTKSIKSRRKGEIGSEQKLTNLKLLDAAKTPCISTQMFLSCHEQVIPPPSRRLKTAQALTAAQPAPLFVFLPTFVLADLMRIP